MEWMHEPTTGMNAWPNHRKHVYKKLNHVTITPKINFTKEKQFITSQSGIPQVNGGEIYQEPVVNN